ncbi:uncharacterized protein LOC143223969 [Tachypleus tridentatus]|uniref:uncharacterized protein LOC143223969 n=1 Tax=Tachypleus tridentatus TaxID=6853 RepID=UPI003FD4EAC8
MADRLVHLKEEYNSVNTLREALKYDEYGWEVIGDFKMVAFLMGHQGGFTMFPFYLCLWDSRDTTAHYNRMHWPQWTELSVGWHNVKCEPLVDLQKVLFLPLYIKLGLMKPFVTALDKESEAFKYLRDFFLKLSEANWTTNREDPGLHRISQEAQYEGKKFGAALSQWFGASWASTRQKIMWNWLKLW